MEENRFIDRYYKSEAELMRIDHTEKRSMNTFITYLESLHSVGDKLKDKFGCNIKNIPEFVILRLIRNYFHHVEDIEDYSIFVELDVWGHYENNRHLLISTKNFSKAFISFRDNTRDKKYVKKQVALMNNFIDIDFFDKADAHCDLPLFTIDNGTEVYELGMDFFKYAYNMSNFIADECRKIDELKNKRVVLGLEVSYTAENNIPKIDFLTHPNNIPLMTTKGMIFPKDQTSIRRVN